MRARLVVVAGVFGHDPAQKGFVKDDDMVEAVSADGADYALAKRILPGRAVGRGHFLDAHSSDTTVERVAVGAVAVMEQEARGRVIRERLDDLLSGPLGRRDLCDIEVDDAAAVIGFYFPDRVDRIRTFVFLLPPEEQEPVVEQYSNEPQQRSGLAHDVKEVPVVCILFPSR